MSAKIKLSLIINQQTTLHATDLDKLLEFGFCLLQLFVNTDSFFLMAAEVSVGNHHPISDFAFKLRMKMLVQLFN